MAEITFLAPGSCQLEVTAQGNVGTDTGVDLASVSWTIEQALIAGCRFSPSAGDVHIDRNGVLTIGRSLFDRINQADGDDAIPGQCTLIIRADSTITKTVLDRFKVLVGYPGEGGGGGGGTDYTISVYEIPEGSEQPVASSEKVYFAEYSDNRFIATQDVATSAPAGTVITTDDENSISHLLSSLESDGMVYANGSEFVIGNFKHFIMPAHDVYVIIAAK